MAKLSKRGVSTLLVILLVTALLSLTMFSCTVRMAQNDTYIDMDHVVLRQLETPSENDPAMIVHTSAGDITAVLYPEAAPNYVATFIELAKSGYYDNTYVYQVQEDVFFSAGSAEEDGSTTGEQIETEISSDLWPFRGAFVAPVVYHENNFFKMLFNNDKSYCDMRFRVCNSIVFDEETKKEMSETTEKATEIADTFLSWGGIPNYAQQMTVFAQAYGKESFSVIDTITGTSTKMPAKDTGYAAPETPVMITSIEITTWGKTNGDTATPENSIQ